jgi:hypothetical protein
MRTAALAAALAAAALLPAVPRAAAEEPAAGGAPPEREGVAVTVYSAPGGANQVENVFDPLAGIWRATQPGFSVVKERRRMVLREGANAIRFEDVAARIDPATVAFRSLTDPAGTAVLQQSFEHDLASADRILEKHIGESLRVRGEGSGQGISIYEGTLVSFDAGQIVLRSADGLHSVARGNVLSISYPALPQGLVVKPTLAWDLRAAKAGEHLVEVAYETKGMSWSADYTAILHPDDGKVDLSAWVTIRNQSGASYRDAGLKLVAGDVHRAPPPDAGGWGPRGAAMELKSAGADEGFTGKAFFEYHLYTLGRRAHLPDRSLQQIELFGAVRGAPCRKVFLYDGLRGISPWHGGGVNMDQGFGQTGNAKVGVFLEVENRKENGMGMPLPAGRVRVHKRDAADGFPELVGEDAIDHTAKDERIRLKVGDAFDLVGERTQTTFEIDHQERWVREGVAIRVRNHKAEPVEVIVAERLHRGLNAKVATKAPFERKDARLLHFPVKVPADGEGVVTLTVTYTW